MLEYTISSLQLNPPAQGFPVGKSRKIRIPSGIGLKTLADKIQVSELCQNVLGAEAELRFLPGAAMLSPSSLLGPGGGGPCPAQLPDGVSALLPRAAH